MAIHALSRLVHLWIHPGPATNLDRLSNSTIAEELMLLGNTGIIAELFIAHAALAAQAIFYPIITSELDAVDIVQNMVCLRPFKKALGVEIHLPMSQLSSAHQSLKKGVIECMSPFVVAHLCLAKRKGTTKSPALIQTALRSIPDIIEAPTGLFDSDNFMVLYLILVSDTVQRSVLVLFT